MSDNNHGHTLFLQLFSQLGFIWANLDSLDVINLNLTEDPVSIDKLNVLHISRRDVFLYSPLV